MFCHYLTFLEIEDSQIWIEILPNVRIRHVDNIMIKVKRKKPDPTACRHMWLSAHVWRAHTARRNLHRMRFCVDEDVMQAVE